MGAPCLTSFCHTEPFADVPPSFSFFGLVVGVVCLRQIVGWSPLCSRYVGYIPVGCVSMVSLCVHAGRGRAHSAIARAVCVCVCVCCLPIASRCGCRSMSGMPTPSRCVAAVHDQMSVVFCPSWAQWLCEVVVGNRGRRATMVTPTGRGGCGKARLRFGSIPSGVCVCRCGGGPLGSEGVYSMATHPSDAR